MLFGLHDPRIIDHASALASQLLRARTKTGWSWAGVKPLTEETSGRIPPALGDYEAERLGDGGLEHRWSAVVVQTPYDEQRTSHWRELAQGDGLTYSGYGVPISNWTDGLYGLPFYRRCTYILLSTPEEAKRHEAKGTYRRRLIHTGDPLLFDVVTGVGESAIATKPTILWMPHWTVDWFGKPGYSTFAETVFDILDVARSEGEATFVVRPHPLLSQPQGVSVPSDPDPHVAYRELLRLPNVELSSRSLVDDLYAGSAVITDGVSGIAYAAAVGLPLAVCRRSDSPRFNEYGERIAATADTVVGSAERLRWIRNQVANPPHRRNESLRLTVLECFPLHDRSPGEIFAERLQ